MYSRKQLLAEIAASLARLGYARVPSTGHAALLLLYKWVTSELVLTLGVERSSLYKDRFTGSFFLAPSFEWSYMLSDYPAAAYDRIGVHLPPEDRLRLLPDEFNEPGVVDAWWIGFNEDSVSSFTDAVSIAEPRFLAQAELAEEVAASREMAEHERLVSAVQSLAASLSSAPRNLMNQPKSYAKIVPLSYLWAAEVVLTDQLPDLVSTRYVALIARDAWLQQHLRPEQVPVLLP